LTEHPACFSSNDQYKEWKLLAIKSSYKSLFICTDCTPEYQAEMIRVGRCEAPDVNVRLFQLREMEDDLRREILQIKTKDLETFTDPWSKMITGLVFVPPPVVKKTRTKKGNNEPTV
jgi:hypothetical protein